MFKLLKIIYLLLFIKSLHADNNFMTSQIADKTKILDNLLEDAELINLLKSTPRQVVGQRTFIYRWIDNIYRHFLEKRKALENFRCLARCGRNAHCESDLGGARICICNTGFFIVGRPTVFDRRVCINPCARNPCKQPNAECIGVSATEHLCSCVSPYLPINGNTAEDGCTLDICEVENTCGPNTVCAMDSSQTTPCSCMTGYHENNPNDAATVGCIFVSDCFDILNMGITESGVYTINVQGNKIQAYCDMETDGGGWTVFLIRQEQATQENFDRDWDDYKNGFGNPPDEYWMGNEALHLMTNNAKDYTLRVDVTGTKSPTETWGKWSTFTVDSEQQNYKLNLGGYDAAGIIDNNPGFMLNNGQEFTTNDRDNDQSTDNCATWFGGFWYNDCSYHFPTDPYGKIEFGYWTNEQLSHEFATTVQMKIRPS